jgi:Domain of unknown function (DUF4386)
VSDVAFTLSLPARQPAPSPVASAPSSDRAAAEVPPPPRRRRLVGAALVGFPLLVQVPFGLLIWRFDYPAILRRPPSEVLTRFAAGGEALIWIWFAYALCVVPFLLTVVALPELVDASASRRRMIRVLGIASALTQWLGLLRWTLVVPALASAYVAPGASDATRAALAVAFDTQHRLFGNLLGEHAGQLTLALWTMSLARADSSRLRRWLGRGAGGLFLLGLGDGLATTLTIPGAAVLAQLPMIAFLAWTAWMVATGAALIAKRDAQ